MPALAVLSLYVVRVVLPIATVPSPAEVVLRYSPAVIQGLELAVEVEVIAYFQGGLLNGWT